MALTHGVFYQIDPSIKFSEQRTAQAATSLDVDGGGLVTLARATSGSTPTNAEVDYVATAPSSATATGVYVAYNPAMVYVKEGDMILPSRQLDRRAHTNMGGYAFDCFKPTIGQVFGILAGNVTGSTAPTVGKFLEPTSGATTYTIQNTQTAGAASFKVVEVKKQHFPTGVIGGEYVDMYVVETVAN